MRKQICLFVLTALLSLPLAAQSIRFHSPKLTARTVAAQLSHKKQNANAFLTLKEDADAAMLASRYGVHLNVKVGNRYTAIVPLQMVDSLANDPSVVRIDIGETAREMLDSVRVLSHIDEIHAGTNELSGSYKGKGVIVASSTQVLTIPIPTSRMQRATVGFNAHGTRQTVHRQTTAMVMVESMTRRQL